MKNNFTLLTFILLKICAFGQESLIKKGTNGYGINIDFNNGIGAKFVVSKWGKKNNEAQFLVGFATFKNPSTTTFSSAQPNFSYQNNIQKSISMGMQFLKHKQFDNGLSVFVGQGLYVEAILPSEWLSKTFDNNILTEYKIKNAGIIMGGVGIPIGAQIILQKRLAIGVQNSFSVLFRLAVDDIELYKNSTLIKKEKSNAKELFFNPILPSLFMRIYFGG
jgi:hypothetical protein